MSELSLSAEQRRALELLGGHGNGCTEDLLVAHGFSRALVAELILAGLASATIERVMAGRKAVEGPAHPNQRCRATGALRPWPTLDTAAHR